MVVFAFFVTFCLQPLGETNQTEANNENEVRDSVDVDDSIGGELDVRIVDLKIEDVAFGGSGVARANGKAVFIPYTIDGEAVSAKITREKKQFAQAEIVDLHETSSNRVAPPCPYFGRCGGCAYQHIDYPHQLEIKSRQVRDVLQRIGKLKNIPMRPIISSPRDYGYRNRITVHAQDGVVGYFRRDSHQLIDVERCPIAVDDVNRRLLDLRENPVRDGHYTLRAKVDRLTRPASSAIMDPVSSLPQSGMLLRRRSTRSENAFHHFTQTNDAIADAIRDLVGELVPADQELLIDAYCGAGFFAKALLDKFERVVGLDWDRFAIATARENATSKETYLAGNVDEQLELLLCDSSVVEAAVSAAGPQSLRVGTRAPTLDRDRTTLIVDPPAVGLSTSVRKSVSHFSPATFIYISCNPATLARDLGELERAFTIESITPLDMFPQTAEIEVVAHLHRFNDSTI